MMKKMMRCCHAEPNRVDDGRLKRMKHDEWSLPFLYFEPILNPMYPIFILKLKMMSIPEYAVLC